MASADLLQLHPARPRLLLLPGPQAPPAPARSGRAALGLVLAAGALLRVWDLNAVGFNSDEAVYVGQGAGIAHAPPREPFFPISRAHPLLFQTVLSFGFKLGLSDGFERLAAAVVGLVNVLLVFEVGRLLYDRRAGLIAAGIFALMPY